MLTFKRIEWKERREKVDGEWVSLKGYLNDENNKAPGNAGGASIKNMRDQFDKVPAVEIEPRSTLRTGLSSGEKLLDPSSETTCLSPLR